MRNLFPFQSTEFVQPESYLVYNFYKEENAFYRATTLLNDIYLIKTFDLCQFKTLIP